MQTLQQPKIKSVDSIDFLQPKIFDVAANTKLYCTTEVPNATAKLDLYFDAGTIMAQKGIPGIVNALLLSGTKGQSAVDLQEKINALGGYIEQKVSTENAILSICSLKENLLPLARIVAQAMQSCTFPQDEIDSVVSERKQKFQINVGKVSVKAQRELKQRLFHSNDAYSNITRLEDFDTISKDEIIRFFESHYLHGLKRVVLIGNFEQDSIDAVIDLFGNWSTDVQIHHEKSFENLKGYAHIEKEDAVQTAVRLGRPLFNKNHPDYIDFTILHTILGDYFGSRLMHNIREDKGYTYGIGTLIVEMAETGYFLVATEVGKEVKDATLKEIQIEFERLQNELVGHEELDMVKNYMLGQLLKSADGPYSMTDLFLSVEIHGKQLEFYNEAIQKIKAITPGRLQELANKYLHFEDFTIITAG